MKNILGSKLEAYKAQQEELVHKYEGKIIAMLNGVLCGVYETKLDALENMQRRYPNGSYFIIKCTKGDGEYTRRFRPRSHMIRGLAMA